ncbi:hypothetical protein QE152_g5041 [Popillia japonica]|uniref:Endonuclease/exonuclease/phosphatase domain-containing protein n=1 Tax=Popillia japonica TaxID=7064 RepID=A0AAW1MYT1_POPJA
MQFLNVAHINVRSLVPKFHDVVDCVLSKEIDILALSESWLTANINSNNLLINDFILFRRDRLGRGGGVCLYVRSGLRPKLLGSNDSFEQLWITVRVSHMLLTVGVIYKPPNADYKAFIDSLEESLSFYGSSSDGVVCLGDVNINILNLAGPATLYFNDMLSSFDLRQVIDELDVLLLSNHLITNVVRVEDFPGSDHDMVFCNLDLRRPGLRPTFKVIRDFRNLNYAETWASSYF